MEQTLNLSTNLRAVDTIKSEILSEVARLYNVLSDYDAAGLEDRVVEHISTIVAMNYILSRRMGLEFNLIDSKICELCEIAANGNHELELAFSDMSELGRYLKRR